MENSRAPLTIAFLGSTGGAGRATLKSLLACEDTNFKLRLFVRSKKRLFRFFPDLSSDSRIQVWEGGLNDSETLRDCLAGASIIICTLGDNRNLPGLSVLEDAAKAVTGALKVLKESQSSKWSKPHLIKLSSVTVNPKFNSQMPWGAYYILHGAFYHAYIDLAKAHTILESSSDLLTVLLVQPPAIMEDEPNGYEISTEKTKAAVTYADLGAAFAEMALDPAYNSLGFVGVSSRKGDEVGKYVPELVVRITTGWISGYVPGYWPVKNFIDRLW